MKNRNGVLSIELLLIIGVLVGGLAAGFNGLKKINKNIDNFKLTQDIKNLSSSLDSFHNNFGAYPEQTKESIISKTNWNQHGTHTNIVKNNIANKWFYKTDSLTSKDNYKISTGYIQIKMKKDSYSTLEDNEIINTLNKTCLNSLHNIKISDAKTIQRIKNIYSWCLFKQDVKIINLDL